MDPAEVMDIIQSLHVKVDCMAESFSPLIKKVNEVTESQQIGGETLRKSADSNNIVIRFLAGLHRLSREELKNTLVEAEAIMNTVNPIPTDQNLDGNLVFNLTKNKLTILVNVFDIHNSLPDDAKANANNAVASTSIASRYVNSEISKEKIQIWRRYKNKYNYIENFKHKLPPLNDSDKLVSIQDDINGTVQNNANSTEQNNANSTEQNNANSTEQNNANSTVQNDLDDNTQNNINGGAQIDLNEKKYTLNDIIQNEDVYEMFRSRLNNSPYDDLYLKNNVSNSKLLTLKLCNGKTLVKPMSYVAPLVMLKKCDDLYPIPPQNKKTMNKHCPSTSNQTNNSTKNSSKKIMTKRKRGANKTKDITNSVKTITEKLRSSIRNREYETSKRKKN